MRKFIVSDLHGNGEVYDSLIGYLENISQFETVTLYINGDLIDRGIDSYRMIEDVMKRINETGNIKIKYLAGNHELMMYQALIKRKPGKEFSHWSDWIRNGGKVFENQLARLDKMEEKCEEYKKFLGKLEIYHKFPEIIDGNQLLLVHAQAPRRVDDICHMKLSDNSKEVEKAVWTREEVHDSLILFLGKIIGLNRIGKDGFVTIIGHTPVKKPGFKYKKKDNYINIDGGCAAFATGHFEYNHVPLVEICNNYLEIIIFNHNNEIIDGYKYDGHFEKINEKELEKKRLFINHSYDNCEEEKKELIKNLIRK